MIETLTAQQEIAGLRETLEYSIECGYVQHVAVRWLRDRHVAVRDAHATELAALTEQVAQLKAENAELKTRIAGTTSVKQALTLTVANRKIDALTEALAAASDPMREQTWAERFRVLTERAEAAERDRDAVRALLREVDDTLENDGPWLPLQYRVRAHLSGQPVALTEQVARLTAERDALVEAVGRRDQGISDLRAELTLLNTELARMQRTRNDAIARAEAFKYERDQEEREVARLTEALAAAEQETDHAIRKYRKAFDRAESAERDRDAANALLGEAKELLWHTPGGHQALIDDIDAHLSGQPAAPAPTAAEARVRECAACKRGGNGGLFDDGPPMSAHTCHIALEARVRELEAHNASLRERNTELVHMRQVAEARVRELEVLKEAHSEARRGYAERVAGLEDELAALRERVAFAIAWLTDIEPKPHSKSWNALEVLRGK